jgi:transcriptional regulator with XRE-family HTH domain
MAVSVPTNLWRRQQHSVGLTPQAFVGTLFPVNATGSKRVAHPDFASRLKEGMARVGIHSSDVVGELRVDKETVRLWMRGERMPRDAELKRLAKMIGVSAADLRYGAEGKALALPQMRGEHVTDEDELRLLEAYRGLKHKEWARNALRRRAIELLEEFGEPGAMNPWGRPGVPP